MTTVPTELDLGSTPEGWASTEIGKVCVLNPGKPPANLLPPDALVSFVPMAAINETSGTITATQERGFAEVRGGYTAFAEGDLIMAKITPCMENGKAAIVRGLVNGVGFGSTEFHVLRPNGAALAEYLYYYVRQESFRRSAEESMAGAVGQLRVPASFVERAPIPLAPLAEQRRIVAQVEVLLANLGEMRERLVRAASIVKRFRQAVLASATLGQLTADWRLTITNGVSESAPLGGSDELPTLPSGWQWKRIAEIGEVQGGIQKQPLRQPRSNHFPYLRVANVLRGRLDLSEVHHMELFSGELERYHLEADDLLIVEGNGSLTEIGRCAIWTGEIQDCVHQNHIIRVRLSGALPQFLNLYWNSTHGSVRVASAAVTTAGLYSLSTKKVANLLVPVPPRLEQNEIVRRAERFLALADAVDRRVHGAVQRTDRLTQAILAKAFRGELVPTEAELAQRECREYEPASVLLERIQAARSAAGRRDRGQKARQLRLMPVADNGQQSPSSVAGASHNALQSHT
jgi:type I restriction enzyme S subunit